jgi:hypothetical protein
MIIKIANAKWKRHSNLQEAADTLGSIAELARFLDIRYQDLIHWIRLRQCPPKTPTKNYPQTKLDELEDKLVWLTGYTLEELFPTELREYISFKNSLIKQERLNVLLKVKTEKEEQQKRHQEEFSPEYQTKIRELRERINKILLTSNFTMQESAVIQSRFGLNGKKTLSLREAAKLIRVTDERIRQIETKAIRKFQQPTNSLQLVEFVD